MPFLIADVDNFNGLIPIGGLSNLLLRIVLIQRESDENSTSCKEQGYHGKNDAKDHDSI